MERFDIRDELENVVGTIIDFLPNILAAIVILIIGALVAALIRTLVRKALQQLRFDRAIHGSSAGKYVSRLVDSPSRFIGRVVYWLIMIGVISLAVGALNLPLLNDLLAGIYGYVPNVIAAVLIFLVASAVSAGAAAFIQRVMGKTAIARLVSTAVPAITMSLAVFMILNQLNIATDIVNILFTAMVGSVALGLALAFGLGGRDVARDLLEQAADNVRSNKDVVKDNVKSAVEKTQRSM
jgi:hypothetical protein